MTGLALPIPYTWQPGDIGNSAILNAQIRDAMTFLLNVPMFFGYQATAQSVPNGTTTLTPILLDQSVIDNYGGHSVTSNTSRYVIQVPGTYQVSGCTAWAANATDERVTTFAKNGTVIVGGSQAQAAGLASHGTIIPSTQLIVPCVAGDYIEVWGAQGSGAALATNADITAGKNSSLMVLWEHS